MLGLHNTPYTAVHGGLKHDGFRNGLINEVTLLQVNKLERKREKEEDIMGSFGNL